MNIFYDYQGKVLTFQEAFSSNLNFAYSRLHDTNYTMFRIFKKKIDGTSQHAFMRILPNIPERKTSYELATSEGWSFVINGGGWEGPTIENSIVKYDAAPYYQVGGTMITIDQNGDFGFKTDVQAGDGAALVQQGIVSAFYSYFPLIVNYENYEYPTDIPDTFGNRNWEIAQKQIIGQFENGDYFILTSEARGFVDSVGFTVPQVQALCKSLGLKFAYHLDCGGSVQTTLGEKRINHCIYDDNGSTERLLPGFIVFNGTNTFSIPNQS